MMMMGPRNISPSWTVPRKRSLNCHGCIRVKILLLAALCVLLGYSVICFFVDEVDTSPATVKTPSYAGPHGQRPQPVPSRLHQPASVSTWLHGALGKWKDKIATLETWKPNRGGKSRHHTSAKTSQGAPSPPINHLTSPSHGLWPGNEDAELVNRPPGGQGKKPGGHLKANQHKVLPNISETTILPNRPALGERARIGKCTILFGNPSSVYERALRTHEEHDRMHNYPLHVLREQVVDDVWNKPAYILSLLLQELAKPVGERLDWLLWVDADTVILNPLIPVETFLPPEGEFDEIHMLVSHDWNGLNNGVFPVRVNGWAVELFTAIMSYRYYRPEGDLTFRDQSAMAALLQEPKFARHTAQVPQRWFNAYQGEHNETLQPFQARRGDFLVHFAGVGDRDARLRYWLERAEQHAPDWEINVRHTSYPEEVRTFWSDFKAQTEAGLALVQDARQKLEALLSHAQGRMTKFESHITMDEAQSIRVTMGRAQDILDDPVLREDLGAIKDVVDGLGQATRPLESKTEEEHQSIVREAHDLIFAAQQSLMTDVSSDLVNQESRRVRLEMDRLKEGIVQSNWHAGDILALMDGLKRAQQALDDAIGQEPPREDAVAGNLDSGNTEGQADHDSHEDGSAGDGDTPHGSSMEPPARPPWNEDDQHPAKL